MAIALFILTLLHIFETFLSHPFYQICFYVILTANSSRISVLIDLLLAHLPVYCHISHYKNLAIYSVSLLCQFWFHYSGLLCMPFPTFCSLIKSLLCIRSTCYLFCSCHSIHFQTLSNFLFAISFTCFPFCN